MNMIDGNDLITLGYLQGPALGAAKQAGNRLLAQGYRRSDVDALLAGVLARPADYIGDPLLQPVAAHLVEQTRAEAEDLRREPAPYQAFGPSLIDPAAITQMELSLRLPVSVGGALMPDAHLGYGLPIGGVLATVGAVIPWAIGVDIACSMRLSVFPQSAIVLGQRTKAFSEALLRWTKFGAGQAWTGTYRASHEVLDRPDWSATFLLRSLKDTAAAQLGTSGSGNHFAEFGELILAGPDPAFPGLDAGKYLALLSHSGSRGVGYKIASHYSKLAAHRHPTLPKEAQALGWLDLDHELGIEYWQGMELAGAFADANHQVIHARVAAALGLESVATITNRHNFAWRQTLPDGREVIVHRKGATPAGAGVLGIIPGNMADAGFVVRGLGNPLSLESASHGAGRAMSRTAAEKTITTALRDAYLAQRDVVRLGGGLDEAPQAYKSLEQVLSAQDELIERVARFRPRIVRMADEPGEN